MGGWPGGSDEVSGQVVLDLIVLVLFGGLLLFLAILFFGDMLKALLESFFEG